MAANLITNPAILQASEEVFRFAENLARKRKLPLNDKQPQEIIVSPKSPGVAWQTERMVSKLKTLNNPFIGRNNARGVAKPLTFVLEGPVNSKGKGAKKTGPLKTIKDPVILGGTSKGIQKAGNKASSKSNSSDKNTLLVQTADGTNVINLDLDDSKETSVSKVTAKSSRKESSDDGKKDSSPDEVIILDDDDESDEEVAKKSDENNDKNSETGGNDELLDEKSGNSITGDEDDTEKSKEDKTGEEHYSAMSEGSNDSSSKSEAKAITKETSKQSSDDHVDYFEMDCEEIDEDDDIVELTLTSDEVKKDVKEVENENEKNSDDSKEDIDDTKENGSEKLNSDVTVISDEDEEKEEESLPTKRVKRSNKEKTKGNEETPENEKNEKADDSSETNEDNMPDTSVKNEDDMPVISFASVPVMIAMDDKKQGDILESQNESNFLDLEANSLVDTGNSVIDIVNDSHTASAAALGLIPVQELSGGGSIPLVSCVSTGFMQGSIPSISPLELSTNPDSAVSSQCGDFITLPSTFKGGLDDKSVAQMETDGSPESTLDDDNYTPPKKRRLLDYDNKWNSVPKYSMEQDKYLALPGGIEANSVEVDTDWTDTAQAVRKN
ncbi:hypothetical protein MAR_012538, partial [Mya arenaria]